MVVIIDTNDDGSIAITFFEADGSYNIVLAVNMSEVLAALVHYFAATERSPHARFEHRGCPLCREEFPVEERP